MSDPTNPDYYKVNGYELMDVIEAFGLHRNHHRASAIQYLFRADRKGSAIENLKKALWYIGREIENLEALQAGTDVFEVSYVPGNSEVPRGFRPHLGLNGSHHAAYAGMAYRCPRCASSEKPHERHGHTECPVCNQVIEDCCDGSC